jgi:2-oxoglutarate dehydrogenase E1 component
MGHAAAVVRGGNIWLTKWGLASEGGAFRRGGRMTMQPDRSSFLAGANAGFVETLYRGYLKDPNSVDPSWAAFFASLGEDASAALTANGASWAAKRDWGDGLYPEERDAPRKPAAKGAGLDPTQVRGATLDSIRALMLIRAFRIRGHLEADLDPLKLNPPKYHAELDPKTYGFGDGDYDRPIFIDGVLGFEIATLRQILERVRAAYCRNIGVEFMHISYPEEKSWIQGRMENSPPSFAPAEKTWILGELSKAEGFERFLNTKFTGTKRFGIDGGESLQPLMEAIIARAAELGTEEVLIGMPHRGRLNVLCNVLLKPYTAVFSEFLGTPAHPQDVRGSGDVKYHLGYSIDRQVAGHTVHMSLAANPSHLEAVNPVVIGRARAKQTQHNDTDRTKVLTILLHGDAAFAGQGLVAECFALSELKGYKTGGTIHIVVNNQIGFTTNPASSRSSPYPSDVAKMVQAPIWHCNGDDPEATVYCGHVAAEFRNKFHRDVVVDMFCYRRFGHNEGDEPSFTQPLMYRTIAKHPTTRQIYAQKLASEGVLTAEQAEQVATDFHAKLDADFEAAKGYKPNKADMLEGAWTGMQLAKGVRRAGKTAAELDVLKQVGERLTTLPADFNAHRTITRLMETKRKMIETGEGIDWATAEALAFGTLVREGYPVRLSGQDCGRGTFSQRHAELTDQQTEAKYFPLANISEGQAVFEVHNSALSEAAVLGFEYGYTLAEPKALVLWEAQFGDFANGAQVIFDQFLCSAESKWLRMSGLVVLLPHGFEGQGPEHSSARLERYLQLCAEDNWQVANCTSPANYFHILRRQMHRDFRKPLIMMTPKSLLRHKRCVSRLDEFGPGSSFHRLLWDDAPPCPDKDVKRVVLCSGKVYFDLLEAREQKGVKNVYLQRIEQLYPFPKKILREELERFPDAEVVWCQEEPQNMGAWSFVAPRIEQTLKKIDVRARRAKYVGRPESASTATGSARIHAAEQAALIDKALTVVEKAQVQVAAQLTAPAKVLKAPKSKSKKK